MTLADRVIRVVGGGIGGVAAATALAQRGARVTLYEQATEIAEVGAGIQLSPNAVHVLDALGAGAAIRKTASRPRWVDMRDGLDDRPVARVELGDAAERRWSAPYLHAHRADILSALLAEAQARGVDLRLGQRIEDATPDGGLVLRDGRPETADVIVAADGHKSQLRQGLSLGRAPTFTGQAAWRGLVPASRVPEGLLPGDTTVFLGPGRHLVTYPVRKGAAWNVVAVTERAEWLADDWHIEGAPSELARAFAGWCAPVQMLIETMDDCHLWGLFAHAPLERWVSGRVALLGDACHPMLPFMAQGASMALEDAWAVAAALDAAQDVETGLARYEAQRRSRTTRVQQASARNGRIFHLRGAPRAALHAGLGVLSSLTPGLLQSRFDWLYGTDVTKSPV